ncbi:hypothetical protein F4779DRAFT_642630 [Xylariaceae sp. FL0662B]|nr:hypothetical protein F4779DRAFT_642630 [Xylariaceae sp. FL0662B]
MDHFRSTFNKLTKGDNDKEQLCEPCHMVAHGKLPSRPPSPGALPCSGCGDPIGANELASDYSESAPFIMRRRNAWPNILDAEALEQYEGKKDGEQSKANGESAIASPDLVDDDAPAGPPTRGRGRRKAVSARPGPVRIPSFRRGDAIFGRFGLRSPSRTSLPSPLQSLAEEDEDDKETDIHAVSPGSRTPGVAVERPAAPWGKPQDSEVLTPRPQLARQLTVPSPSPTHFHVSPFAPGREGSEVPVLTLSEGTDDEEGEAEKK